MAIVFGCTCGKQLQVRDDLAGRKIKCPGCQGILVVPSAGPAGDDAEGPAAFTAGRHPSARPARSGQAGWDEDEETPRGRRTSQAKKQRSMWPWVATIVVLLLLAGGVTAWFVWFRGGKLSADLELVPRDAVGFASFRVADFWKSETGKQIQPLVGQSGGLEQMKQATGGLTPEDIDRVTIVFPEPNENFFVIIATSKPVDQQKILSVMLRNSKETSSQGKTYHANSRMAVHFVSSQILVAGSPGGVQAFLQKNAQPVTSGPLTEALQLAASNKHHLVIGVNPPTQILQAAKAAFQPGRVPPELAPVQDFLDLQSATITADLGKEFQMDLRLTFPDDAKAKKAQASAKQLVATGRKMLAGFKNQFAQGAQAAQMGAVFTQVDQTLADLPVKQEGKVVHIALHLKGDTGTGGLMTALMVPSVQKAREAAARAQSSNNLRQLAFAMHSYADAHQGQMPPAVFGGGLSWRVALLPYIEQQNLYSQFKLNEPWNSPHNSKLLALMPKTYAHPNSTLGPNATSTYYQVFTGQDTPFKGNLPPRMPATFQDGTSNTFLIVEAATPVPWTQPVDLPYDRNLPLPRLGGLVPGGFNAALADGSVRFIPTTMSQATLRAAITPAGNEAMGGDWGR